jgi:hypothetical protein
MSSAHVCHPEAMRPPVVARAAFSSVWNGWGSNSRANAMISSAETSIPPYSTISSAGKSSNVSASGMAFNLRSGNA